MKKTILRMLILSGFLFPAMALTAQEYNADDVLGLWLNEDGDAHVEILKNDGKYYGKIVWLKFPIDDETGKPKLDKHNPDDELKKEPVMGLEVLKDFEFDGDDEWEDGTIYDPKNGKTYSCYIRFNDSPDELRIRGYIGISLIGRTTYWTRVK